MPTSNTHGNIPSDNPLKYEDFDVVKQKAASFWRHHKLGELVDEDDFVKGAMVFKDLRGAREYEFKLKDSPNAHTIPAGAILSERQQFLSALTPRQNTSLRWYSRRTKYTDEHENDSFAKDLLFSVGDALVNSFWERPDGVEDKFLWDHVKTFSTARWQIFATCCLAAMTQGWDQSAMNGANIAWPEDLNIESSSSTFGINIFGFLNAAPFLVGAILATLLTDPLIDAGLGRRWAIALGGLFSLIPVVCTMFVNNWKDFMVCRILLGVGMGAKASVVPIYITEIAPEDIRGRMSMCWQLFDTLGILTGSIVNYIIYSYNQSKPNWRIMIGLSGIPALLFLTLILFCVESPRWLVKKNRYRQALAALITLHQLPSPMIACGELYMIFRRLEAEETEYLGKLEEKELPKEGGSAVHGTSHNVQQRRRASTSSLERQGGRRRHSLTQSQESYNHHVESSSSTSSSHLAAGATMGSPSAGEIYVLENRGTTGQAGATVQLSEPAATELKQISLPKRIKLLGRVQHIRRAVRASQFVMAAQQACGINILAFMSNITFAKAMTPDDTSLHLSPVQVQHSLEFSIYFGIANHFSTFVPLFLIDGAGRRTLLKWTFPLMALSLVLGGAGLLLRNAHPEVGLRMFYGFTVIFTFFFSVGEGPAAFVISSEVFPLIVRELGMSLAVFTNFFLASLLSFSIPHGLSRAANTGGFWMAFAGLNVLLWVMSLLFVYETSGQMLEGINKKYNHSWKEGSPLQGWISRFWK